MKDVGRTTEGKRLIEMNDGEYTTFAQLCEAVENKSAFQIFMKSPHDIYFREGYDFSSVFEVIRAFYEARFRLTDLQNSINAIRESLSK